MDHIRDQIVRGALMLSSHLGREQLTELYPLHREVDDGRVLLEDEEVLREPLEVEDDVRRQQRELESAHRRELGRLVLLLDDAVELVEDGEDGYLGNDVLAHLVREERRWRQVARQVHKRSLLHRLLAGKIR